MQLGVWIVLFCDEINLPDMDAYGTQRVISFLIQVSREDGLTLLEYKLSFYVKFIRLALCSPLVYNVYSTSLTPPGAL